MKNVFRKERDGSYTLDLYFRLAYYSHFCLMEGLNFNTGIFRVRMHDFSILPFYSSEQCLPHSQRTVQLRSVL